MAQEALVEEDAWGLGEARYPRKGITRAPGNAGNLADRAAS